MKVDFFPYIDHLDYDQLKRQKSASAIKSDKFTINQNFSTGTFIGSSGVYLTSLTSCDCMDNSIRRLPCKHMYRLASEVGVFDYHKNVLMYNDILKLEKEINTLLKKLNVYELEEVLEFINDLIL